MMPDRARRRLRSARALFGDRRVGPADDATTPPPQVVRVARSVWRARVAPGRADARTGSRLVNSARFGTRVAFPRRHSSASARSHREALGLSERCASTMGEVAITPGCFRRGVREGAVSAERERRGASRRALRIVPSEKMLRPSGRRRCPPRLRKRPRAHPSLSSLPPRIAARGGVGAAAESRRAPGLDVRAHPEPRGRGEAHRGWRTLAKGQHELARRKLGGGGERGPARLGGPPTGESRAR